ncbi:hypothetical protein Hanom_Chr08g00708371 [Helianthus anomalus]
MDRARVNSCSGSSYRHRISIFIYLFVLFISRRRWLFYLLYELESSIIIFFGEFGYDHHKRIIFFVNNSKTYYLIKTAKFAGISTSIESSTGFDF